MDLGPSGIVSRQGHGIRRRRANGGALSRTLKTELLDGYSFPDIPRAQRAFDSWRRLYKHQSARQEALDMNPPASRYHVSPRTHARDPIASGITEQLAHRPQGIRYGLVQLPGPAPMPARAPSSESASHCATRTTSTLDVC